MGWHRPYKERRYTVGQQLLTLRTRTKLTQNELAALVGVNRRSLQNWESGAGYPREDSLQRLIAVFLSHDAFTSGQERGEAEQLWAQVSQDAPRPLALFDIAWFAQLLTARPVPDNEARAPTDAPAQTLPTGLVTFLATDIEGSTQRWEQAPQAMQQALTRHHAILRHLTALYHGQVFHTAGDSFICVFVDAPAALQSGLAIQRALLAEPWPEVIAPLRVRMALHSGAAISNSEEYVAEPTLNRLSRVLAVSQGGKILLTQATVDLIGAEWPDGVTRRDLGVQQLRDVTVPLQLWQALAPDLPNDVPEPRAAAAAVPHVVDLGEAIDVPALYGREAEVAILEQWMLADRCRVVAVLGLGGIGKTSLAISVAQQIAPRFDAVLFRSLRNAPPLESLLDSLIRTASNQQVLPPDSLADKIARLVQLCRERRCLLVLDNLETIMQAGEHAGNYRADYADYGELVRRLAETQHQSCLLLTSREKPGELGPLEGPSSPVRSLILGGLTGNAAQIILAEKALTGNDADLVDLAHRCGGNPLALKLVAGPIRELFGGDVAAFLTASEPLFNSVGRLLEQQVNRASAFEQSLLAWLAIEREPTSLDRLLVDLGQMAHRGAILAALEALRHRSLIERGAGQLAFTLQPVITEYMTERLVGRVFEEIANRQPELLRSHALVQATAKNYVRRTQEQLIAVPLLERLTTTCGGAAEVEQRLLDLLRAWQNRPRTAQGYGPGNVVNLLRLLRGNLRGLDLSNLFIRHAYLPEGDAQDASLANSHVSESVFAEAFDYPVSVALSADGSYLAAGTTGGDVRLWRMADRTPVLSVQAHLGMVWTVAFAANGHVLASGGTDGSIRLWETASGTCRAILQGQIGMVSGVAISADGQLVAGCGTNGNIQLWETINSTSLAILEGHIGAVWDVALSADGRLLASVGLDGTVRLWETATGTCEAVMHEHTSVIYSVALSVDGRLLASGGGDGTVRLWETASGTCQNVIEGRSGMIYSVTLSADGALLASGGMDGTIRLWETSSGTCQAVLQGHAGVVRGVALAADGQLLASGGGDGTIRVWETANSVCLAVLQGRSSAIYSVVLGVDGQQLVCGSSDGTIRVWETASGTCRTVLQGHTGVVWSVVLSVDARLIASGGTDGIVRLWEPTSGERLASLQGHTGVIYSLALTPNGQLLASGSTDGTIRLWEPTSAACLAGLHGHTGQVWSVALSADGRLLASGGGDGTVRLWETVSKACLAVLQGHSGAVLSVALSADGQLLASGGGDGTVRLWETSSGTCQAVLEAHTGFVWGVALTADGQGLASSGTDGMVRLWETASGTALHTLDGHTGVVRNVALAADGRFVASAGLDGMVRLWETASGTALGTLRPDRPYERLDIKGLSGVTAAQQAALKALGAVEYGEHTTAHDDRAHPIAASQHRSSSALQDVATIDVSPREGHDHALAASITASNLSDTLLADPLLATKFFVPAVAHSLIARPRLLDLLDAGRQRPLTLVSAPPGFGKTTLLAQWLRQRSSEIPFGGVSAEHTQNASTQNPELIAQNFKVAWVSLDEDDNDLVRFWLYVLTALDRSQPGLTEALIMYVRRQQAPPIQTVVTMLLNALAQSTAPLLLVLDDYHVITEVAVHRSLTYLLEHLPPQLQLVLASRADPPLPLALLRARGQILEVRLDQLRATGDEVDAFLRQAMGLILTPYELAVVEDRTEGWLAGLQLVGLALRHRTISIDILEQVSGQQGFILDYLTEEVLRQQPEAVQTFLLRTSILDRMSAPLCEAVLGNGPGQLPIEHQVKTSGLAQVSMIDAQSMLEHLERANLFVVPLDTQRRWYRYHALFAEALRAHLKRDYQDAIPTLYLHASMWYERQGDIYAAIQYAGQAHAWQRVADLIEPMHQLGYQGWQQRTVRRWIEQIPASIVRSRPQLCIVYAMALFVAGALLQVEDWLQAAEIGLRAPHRPEEGTSTQPVSRDDLRKRLLGAIAARRASIAGYYGDPEAVERQARQALANLSEQDDFQRAVVIHAQGLLAVSAGQVVIAAERMREASTRMRAIGSIGPAINWLSVGASYVHMRGHLHAAWQMYQQASELGTESHGLVSSEVGVAYAYQADVLREWNQLDAALTLVQQGLDLTEQAGFTLYLGRAYIGLARIYLSQGSWDAAEAAIENVLRLPTFIDNPYQLAWLVTVDQVRLWIARGALDRATRWAATLNEAARPNSPFARERQDVALARINLAQRQPVKALARLEPFFASATTNECWDHVIEMRLLQALAHEQLRDEAAALAALAEAVRLGETEVYIRRFVDEGPQVAALLVLLRDEQRKQGPTPYLDIVLAAFST
jgi:ATP/maltotriose-dependent transcriptional regulator MalT/WD40 repeat protein/class 3 adenylate cyclase/DNA-binding XRE family transcriptional regulator